MTGSSKRRPVINETWSPEVHSKHHVDFELSDDGVYLHGKISDQRLIDKLLRRNVLTVDQHSAADRYYHIAFQAGTWPGQQMRGEYSDFHPAPSYPRALALLGIERYLNKAAGYPACAAVWEVVVCERVAHSELLEQGLNALVSLWWGERGDSGKRHHRAMEAATEAVS